VWAEAGLVAHPPSVRHVVPQIKPRKLSPPALLQEPEYVEGPRGAVRQIRIEVEVDGAHGVRLHIHDPGPEEPSVDTVDHLLGKGRRLVQEIGELRPRARHLTVVPGLEVALVDGVLLLRRVGLSDCGHHVGVALPAAALGPGGPKAGNSESQLPALGAPLALRTVDAPAESAEVEVQQELVEAG